MKKKDDRRSFIKKLAALSSVALVSPKSGLAMTENNTSKSPVNKIKALGFQWETQDPFLFCVHHEDYYPEGNVNLGPNSSLEGRQIGQDFIIKDGWRMYHGTNVPGFPGHPHRGFETITIVRKGMVDHTDSLGGAGRYGDGDVQWMTSGKGVQHAEMFPCINQDKPNPLELFQIWINLPKKSKFVEPHYKMLWDEEIPKITMKDENGKGIYLEVVAGNYGEYSAPKPPPNSWAADPDNEVTIYNIQLDPEASLELPLASPGINRTVYFFEGDNLTVGDKTLDKYHAAELESDQNISLKAGSKKAYILMLQGKPIGEPVVQHGPFVMNTREEIQQTFHDYQKDQFGGWPWSESGPVHPVDKGRFALHSDGNEEIKG